MTVIYEIGVLKISYRDNIIELRVRKIAALQASVRDTPSPRRQGRLAAYAIACALFVVFAASLAVLQRPAPPPVETVFDTTRFDAFLQQQIVELESPWETLLLDEAQHMATDAREVGEYLLASLPFPSMTRSQ